MRTLAVFALAVVLLASNASAQSPLILDKTSINRIEQDSTGQVWGVDSPSRGDLYRWESDQWKITPVEGVVADSRPAALATGPDGAVYCLWTSRESDLTGEGLTVTRHKGSESKTLAHFFGELAPSPSIFVDPHGTVWITEHGIHIYRVTPDGKADCAYTIEYDHRNDANQPRGARMNFAPIHATADGLGRVWFWSGEFGVPALDGVLICDEGKFFLDREFPGPPSKRYNLIEADVQDHMWVTGMADQLYRVELRTLSAEAIPEPARNVLRFAQSIFHAGGATYVLSVEGSVPVDDPAGGGRLGTLWQLKDGEWKRVLNGIDMRPRTTFDASRSFAQTPAGLWLGAFGTGPWFIPAGYGEPLHIDWRYGFPFDDSGSVATLPDGRLLVVAERTGTTVFKPREMIAEYRAPARVQTLHPRRGLLADRNNHLWGFLSADTSAISEWDGKTWSDHRIPEDLPPASALSYAMDSRDRIWMTRALCGGAIAVFDTASGKVEDYSGFPAAFQAQLAKDAGFHIQGQRFFPAPAFSSDGRIGYNDGCGQVRYFDGHDWQIWRAQDIDTTHRMGFEGAAFFDHAGNFAVNMGARTWEYSSAQGWHTTTYEQSPGSDQSTQPERLTPPPGCDLPNPRSVIRDRLGTYWIVSAGQLYRAVFGLCVTQFAPDEHQPFIDSRILKGVLIDPQGNAFLETYFRRNPNFGEYVILNARRPLPETKLQASVDDVGALTLEFVSSSAAKVMFTWRIDDGDWSAPSPKTEASVDWLTEGKHLVEAAALDEHLQIDPHPAVAEVVIHPIAQARISALIAQLKDSDYAKRDAAVAALARQPDLALPMLQSQREKADPDQRWWIDAAIQEIHDKAANGKQP